MLQLENIKLEKVDNYFHRYYAPGLSKVLKPYKKELVDAYYSNNRQKEMEDKELRNYICAVEEVNITVEKVNTYIVEKYYIAGNSFNDTRGVGIYVQNNESPETNPHMHLGASIISTMYLDPPKETNEGSLAVQLYPYPPIIEEVREDYVYFMPNWVIHASTPQTSPIYRVCLNWSYDCEMRVINKLTGDRW